MSDPFRQALVDPGPSAILDHEIALAQCYLAIEKVRFGERLRLEWSIGVGTGDARLPLMLLPPLVEMRCNSVVEPSPEGVPVRVSTERRGSRVVV